MTSAEIRDKFLKFFESRGHKVVPSSSLVPENDSSVLFTTAGMQQFKPYYTGDKGALKDFGSLNTVSVQKCVRTSDIDEVGDESHLTFFEMLGNFSFGGYGRKEAIVYAHDFITKELGLEISFVTFYEGSENVPKDEESKKAWEELDIKNIKESGDDVFWGPTGNSGPCGPTTEIYCKNSEGKDVEIWNIVFNEYFCDGSRDDLNNGKAKLTKLPTLGIDTGMGLERLVMIVQKVPTIFDTDLFNGEKTREARILADHMRAVRALVKDGVIPSNTGRGYVLRRLIRRATRYADMLGIPEDENENLIIKNEADKFRETLNKGLKEFEKGADPFVLATTYGFPIELTLELANDKGIEINLEDFNKKMIEHQKLSQTSSAGMFRGGLANTNEKTVKLHTAHHLLLSALQEILGKEVKQRGSNITEERLRMDFVCPRKLTAEEIKQIEEIVNKHIQASLTVTRREMPLIEAETLGAEMEFGTKYPEIVSLYFIEDKNGKVVSKEFCGGPHVENTSELGHFKILKEEAVSAGVRRIKAVLE